MIKTIEIKGVKYTYNNELWLVIVSTTLPDSDKMKHLYYSNGLESGRSIELVSKNIKVCIGSLKVITRIYFYCNVCVKSIEQEIAEMVEFGCAKEFFDMLLTYCAVEIGEGKHTVLGYREKLAVPEYYAPAEFKNKNQVEIPLKMSEVPRFYFC